MQNDDVTSAISAALSGDWETAKKLNTKLLEENPEDVDCLNRLGRAFLELGDQKKAANCFKKVLKINPYDSIAQKNLARSSQTTTKRTNGNGSTHIRAFIEEPGITKLISLVNIAPAKALFCANYGDPVTLTPKRHTIFVQDENKAYLGALPDDISHRLLLLMDGGNKYEGYVKSVSKNAVSIFVREIFRAKKFHNTPSFVTSGMDYLSNLKEDSQDESVQHPPESEDEEEFVPKVKTYLDEVEDEG